MATILDIRNLTKRFGTLTAVDGISLRVDEGEIFGFLGPNGAGKTTTISMLTTLILPTSGTASIGGHDLLKDAAQVRGIIGVVPQTFALFPELTPVENLEYIGKLYGMEKKLIKERTHELLGIVTLRDHKDTISGNFSGGMKQRLSLAASIMSMPKILFMDEPTTGLDPQSRLAIRDLTRNLNKRGMTIIYTTHDMEEAEKLCHRITIMDKGKIIADGTSTQIKRLIGKDIIIEVIIEKPAAKALDVLRSLAFVKHVRQDGNILDVSVKQERGAVIKIAEALQKNRLDAQEIRLKEHSLEDVFIALTKKDLRD